MPEEVPQSVQPAYPNITTKKPFNWKLVFVSVLVGTALVGVLGYTAFVLGIFSTFDKSNLDTYKNTPVANSAEATLSAAKKSSEEKIESKEGKTYFKVSEFNIKFEVTEETKNLVYTQGNHPSYVHFTSVELLTKEVELYHDGVINCDTRSVPIAYVRSLNQSTSSTPGEELIVKVSDDVFIYYSFPSSSNCFRLRPLLRDLITKQSANLKNALKTSQLINKPKDNTTTNGYLEVPELGIKFKADSSLKDLVYDASVYGAGPSARFSSKTLINKEKELYGDEQVRCNTQGYPLGTVSIRKTSSAVTPGEELLKQVSEGKYVFYIGRGNLDVNCNTRTQLIGLMDDLSAKLKATLKESEPL